MKYFWPLLAVSFASGPLGCAHITPAMSQEQGLAFHFTAPDKKFSKGKDPLSSSAILTYPPWIAQKSARLCGLAAAKMIASYYEKTLNAEDMRALQKTAERMGGASGQEMKNLFENSGFQASVFPGAWDKSKYGILTQIDYGRPLIVMLKKASESHYVVLDGYDPLKKLVILNDPARGQVALTFTRFKTGWNASGRFTLLAIPKEDPLSP